MRTENNYILLYKNSIVNQDIIEQADISKADIPMRLKAYLNGKFHLKDSDWVFEDKLYHQEAHFAYNYNGKLFEIDFEIYRGPGKNYFNVIVIGHTISDRIGLMEEINSLLYNEHTDLDRYYTVILSKDAVSEYYGKKAFPRLAEFERVFRRLLYNIYILNFDDKYYEQTIHEDIIKKAKGNIRGSKKNKEERYQQEFFYSLDYFDLQEMLFKPRWTRLEEKAKDEFLNLHSDLGSLNDKTLRNFVNAITPRCDWERFFADKIPIGDIKEQINYIREQRNKVAHSKFFGSDEYKETMNVTSELLKKIQKAVLITQNTDFYDMNRKFVKDKLTSN